MTIPEITYPVLASLFGGRLEQRRVERQPRERGSVVLLTRGFPQGACEGMVARPQAGAATMPVTLCAGRREEVVLPAESHNWDDRVERAPKLRSERHSGGQGGGLRRFGRGYCRGGLGAYPLRCSYDRDAPHLQYRDATPPCPYPCILGTARVPILVRLASEPAACIHTCMFDVRCTVL